MGATESKKVVEEKKPEKPWWTFPYPAPGKVEEHNREARQMVPDTFEGFRAEFNREFGGGENGESELLVTHLATATQPKQLSFSRGKQPQPQQLKEGYMLAAQFNHGILSFMGRVDRSKRVFGTLTISPKQMQESSTRNFSVWNVWNKVSRIVLQAQTHSDGNPTEIAAELSGNPITSSGTTHLKLQSEAGIIALGHMQSITENLSLGMEAIHVQATKYNGLSYAMRLLLPKSDSVVACLYSMVPSGFDISYTQRFTKGIRCSTELNLGHNPDTNKLESGASVGWEYRAGDMLVRGKVDDKLAIATSIEESLGNLFRVSLSADIDFPHHSYLWGFGLQVSS